MLVETEEQLPRWLRRHVQFEKHLEYPNKPVPLKTRVIKVTVKQIKLGDKIMF